MRRTLLLATAALAALAFGAPATAAEPVRLLIITGDNAPAHDWQGTTRALQDFLSQGGNIKVDVTSTPAKDLNADNLDKYDVLLLNYKETPQGSEDSRWSEDNKRAFLDAVKGGKGLVVSHYASAAFAKPNWAEFEKAIAGGWRTQGFHGPKHEFVVKKTDAKHPISEGLPAQFDHKLDELYQNSLLTPGSVVLATAYSDPSKPRGTGKDEAVIWVNQYGKGRVVNVGLGHDTTAMADPAYQSWMRRAVVWAGRGEVDSGVK